MEENESRKGELNVRPKFFAFGLFLFFAFALINFTVIAGAQPARAADVPPAVMTYQGKLLISGKLATTTQNIYFILYDSYTGGSILYTASGTAGTPQPIAVGPIQGLFSVNLGNGGTNTLDPAIFANDGSVYLEVRVGADTLTPRKRITSAPYAFNAKYLDGYGASTGHPASQHIPVSDASGNFVFNSTTVSTSSINDLVVGNSVSLPANSIGPTELANTTVTATTYGASNSAVTFTVDADGRLTYASSTLIAINANQITAGTIAAAQGGTGQDSSGWTGFVKVAGGTWMTSTINLVGGDVSGVLLVPSGGTGTSTLGAVGSVVYTDGTGYAFLPPVSTGQLLQSNVGAAPSWVATSSLGFAPSSGSNSYIQNQSSADQSASFRISGNGYIAGNVGIGTTSPAAQFTIVDGAILAVSSTNPVATVPVTGAGTRMMWIPGLAAFRAGSTRAYLGPPFSMWVGQGNEWDTGNIGQASAAFGVGTVASGWGSFAAGASSSASGIVAMAFGYNAQASGLLATALGNGSIASGWGSFAIGNNAQAIGTNAIVLGASTASGTQAVAVGTNNVASGYRSFTIGTNNTASGQYSVAMGQNMTVNATNSFGIDLGLGGGGSTLDAESTFGIFNGSILATGNGNTPASGGGTRLMWIPSLRSFRAGTVNGTQWDSGNIGNYSAAFGENNTASGGSSFAFGGNNTASGYASFVSGANNTSSNFYSFAGGVNSIASNSMSFAYGYHAISSGDSSFAFGRDVTSSANQSVAFGYQATSIGQASFAAGQNVYAAGYNAIALGSNAVASSSGNSTAIGTGVTSTGQNATALGNWITVSGNGSFGIGLGTPFATISDPNVMSIIGGNVGIGTTHPSSTLDVSGNIIITGGGAYINFGNDVGSGGYGIRTSGGAMEYKNFGGSWSAMGGSMPSGSAGQTLVSAGGTTWNATDSLFIDTFGNVGIGITSPAAKLSIQDGAILAAGTTGATPVSGAGTRMMWIPSKATFLAGAVSGNNWNDVNIGSWSGNIGYDNLVSSSYSFAAGYLNSVTGNYSFAGGYNSIATSPYAFSYGYQTKAQGVYSVAMGQGSVASNNSAFAAGWYNTASGTASLAFGVNNVASGDYSIALGYANLATSSGSIAIGSNNISHGYTSIVIGSNSVADGSNSFAIGNTVTSSGSNSFAFGQFVTVGSLGGSSFAFGLDSTKRTINNTNVFAILGASNGVWINTTTYTGYKLMVDADATSSLGIGVNGKINATGFITQSTNLDLAERYRIDSTCSLFGTCPSAGDLVCLKDASVSLEVEKCSVSYNKKVVGIVSTEPGFLLAGGLDDANSVMVALSGRVPVKVSTSNGAIHAGDKLTSSADAGVAMLATEEGTTVGTALEDFSGPGNGTIMVYTSIGWNNKLYRGLTLDEDNHKLIFPTTSIFESNVGDSALAKAFIFDAPNFNSSTADRYVISVRSNNTPVFSVSANGDVNALGNYYGASAVLGTSTNPGDLAERVDIAIDDTAEAGDVMMVDPNNADTFRRTSNEYEQSVAGVISTNPTLIVGNGRTDYKAILAMVGRVPVKVTNINGAVKRGDLLVASAIKGYAMKYDPSKDASLKMVGIIGIALENQDEVSNNGKVTALIRTGWIYNRDQTIASVQTHIQEIAQAQGINLSPDAEPGNLNVGGSTSQLSYTGGALNLNNNPIINVSSIIGANNKWRIDDNGNFIQTIATAKGDKELYGMKSGNNGEIIITGTSTLENGIRKVMLSDLDQEIIDKNVPLNVQITMGGDTKGVYISERNFDSFTVKENENGASNAPFDWTVIAKVATGTAVTSAPVPVPVPPAPSDPASPATPPESAPASPVAITTPASEATPDASAPVDSTPAPAEPTTPSVDTPAPAETAPSTPTAPADSAPSEPAATPADQTPPPAPSDSSALSSAAPPTDNTPAPTPAP